MKLKYFNTIALMAIMISCTVEDGEPGINSLVNTLEVDPGVNCITGGVKIETGMDLDRNNILNSEEITSVQYVCNGNNASSDRLTRIEIPAAGANTGSTGWLTTGYLIKFNKIDYQSDSIVFVTDPYVASSSNTVTVELVNGEDNTVIAGSTITTNKLFDTREFIASSNIYEGLPETEITLRVRMKSGIQNAFAANTYTGLYLFVYKKGN